MADVALDHDLVGLEVDETGGRVRSRFVAGASARPDGGMYGGTGIAASVLAMEAATGRSAQWITTQFVRAPTTGEVVELLADVVADGGRTAQVQVRACVGDQLAFTSLGSTGIPLPDGLQGQFATMPPVSAPDPEAAGLWGAHRPDGGAGRVSYAEAAFLGGGPHPDARFGHLALWVRRADGQPFTAAALAYAADMVPVAVARAAGRFGAGASLDNSMRFAAVGTHEWVLLELAGDFANGGYGNGSLRAWGEDGTLLATGGQTSNMRFLFDEAMLPEVAAQVMRSRP